MKNISNQIIILVFTALIISCKNDTKFYCGNEDVPYSESNEYSEGKLLFKENCASCHNKNLRDKLTASPLGNIIMFRDSVYLYKATKNFMKLVASGNKEATCQFIKYNKCAMTSFENLEDREIVEIYRFITEESKRLRLMKY